MLVPPWCLPLLWQDRLTRPTLQEPPQSNSTLSTELSAIRLSRQESRVLLPDTSSLLPELSTFPSPLPPMLLESSRTPLSPSPLLPIAPAPLAAIPPAPRNLGPAPADTVTQQR